MKAAFSIVDALGPRVRLHAPRGTPSRVLKLRLVNSIRRHGRCFNTPPTSSSLRPDAADLGTSHAVPGGRVPIQWPAVGDEELGLLRDILSQGRTLDCDATRGPHLGAGEATVANARIIDQPTATADLRSFTTSALLRAFRNTRKTFEYLKTVTSPIPTEEDTAGIQDTIASLPQNTFSELLRSLDPVNYVSKELDPAAGIHVGPGVTQYTDLGRSIDEFGVRRIYLWLLRRLVAAAQLRTEAGHGLLQSDYKILLRCAGAASDLHMAKKIWQLMEGRGQISLRDGDAYNEFVKARFLTDALYTQFDMARFRVSPVNMHKQKIWLSSDQLTKIRKLRYNILAQQGHRFGQNRYTPEKAEGLVRVLRKTKPVRKVFLKIVNDGVAIDEKLLCSAMVAFARNGAMQFIRELILFKYWRIKVHVAKETREVTVSGGTTVYKPDSPMHPTVRLLDAVVESFGCNAEITTAFKVLDFISRRYNIPIPDSTWSKLLEWTYVQSSRPASTEWKLAGWPEKMVQPDAVQMVWDTMTSEPYNVRPGFNGHIILIKSLLSQGRLKDAMHRMLELQPIYSKALVDLEAAFFEHAHTSRLGVDTAQSLRRWLRARTRKQTMWYAIQTCCWILFKRVRSNRVDDVMTARLVPQLVDAFRPFFARSVRYRTATGVVEIKNPNPVGLVWSSTRTVRLPALVTQDTVGRSRQEKETGGGDERQPDSSAVLARTASRKSDMSKLSRHIRVRTGNKVASNVLPATLRDEVPSSRQLLQEFA